MTDQELPATRRTWVGEWMRSEAFWRDVASRSLSGVIVVGFGAGVAAAAGFVPWEPTWRFVLLFGIVIAASAVLLIWSTRIMVGVTSLFARRFSLTSVGRDRVAVAMFFLYCLFFMGVSWLLAFGLGAVLLP